MPALWVVLKGAPEVVRQFLANPPADYDRSYKRFAAQGARYVSTSAQQSPEASVRTVVLTLADSSCRTVANTPVSVKEWQPLQALPAALAFMVLSRFRTRRSCCVFGYVGG